MVRTVQSNTGYRRETEVVLYSLMYYVTNLTVTITTNSYLIPVMNPK